MSCRCRVRSSPAGRHRERAWRYASAAGAARNSRHHADAAGDAGYYPHPAGNHADAAGYHPDPARHASSAGYAGHQPDTTGTAWDSAGYAQPHPAGSIRSWRPADSTCSGARSWCAAERPWHNQSWSTGTTSHNEPGNTWHKSDPAGHTRDQSDPAWYTEHDGDPNYDQRSNDNGGNGRPLFSTAVSDEQCLAFVESDPGTDESA